jgi:hypothetical protein
VKTKVERIDCSTKKGKIRTGNWIKPILIVAGTLFVGLGVIGIFLPVLPTTPFLLLAAACYAKSSRRFYCWLLNNRWFGVYIKNYRQKKGMPLKIKIFTVVLLWLTILVSVIFAVQSLAVRIILIIIAFGVSLHILSIKTLKE